MDNTTIVLPTARAIRSEQLSIELETTFLPNYITMSEFISKLCIVDGYHFVDDDIRYILLLEASDFKNFSSLKIDRSFFTFTKNASYIFKFFEELSAEMYKISDLVTKDIYGEYEEHIAILQNLYQRYEAICLENNVIDKIFLPKYYKLNQNFLNSIDTVELKIDGHLTNFEIHLLNEVSEFCTVKIHFQTSRFNKKMQNKFLEHGLELQIDYEYIIVWNDKTVISSAVRQKNENVSCESFSETLLQLGFIKQKIDYFIQKGYEPHKIAVVLPNESFASKMKAFDIKNNFNFAMGTTFTNTQTYKKISATLNLLDQKTQENFSRVDRIGEQLYIDLLSIFHQDSKQEEFLNVLENFGLEIENKAEKNIFDEELYKFRKLIPKMGTLKVKALLNLFLQRVSKRSLDDVMGGKITVMGLLETRSVSFDAVIIVDFSDEYVPKKSNKDMFLNTHLREVAKLPTMKDRENLQKHYYEILFSRSKEVAISYVSSVQSSGSKFLKQLGIEENKIYTEEQYAEILFTKKPTNLIQNERIVQEYSFKDKKISATNLKTYLTCKRKYYYKYVKNIKSHTIPQDIPQEYEIGNNVHKALSNLYKKNKMYHDPVKLQKDLEQELNDVCGESELDRYLIDLQKKRLEKFYPLEIDRFADGWEVFGCEVNLSTWYEGIELIGQVDRIDLKENQLYVLDYKTGSYTLNTKNNFSDAVDFQLEFYYLLASTLDKEVQGCAFYDLKEIEIVPERFLEEKLEILKAHIKDLLSIESIDFELCEDTKHCVYCDYKIMCGRE